MNRLLWYALAFVTFWETVLLAYSWIHGRPWYPVSWPFGLFWLGLGWLRGLR